MDLGDPGGCGQGMGGESVVPGEHRGGVPGAVEPGDHLPGLRAQLIAHRDRPKNLPVLLDEHGGGPGALHPLDLGGQGPRVDPPGPAQAQAGAVQGAVEPGPGHGVHLGHLGPLRCGGEDGPGQGVFAAGLQSGSQPQHPFPAHPGRGGDLDDGRVVAGEGAGLVQGDGADLAQGLHRGPALDQHPDAAGGSDRGHHGDGHRDRQGARGSGDQHDQGAFEPQDRLPHDEPVGDDQGGDDEDARHQAFGDRIGQSLAGAFAGLLGLDDVHDLRQGIVLGGAGDFHLQRAGAVDGPGVDLRAGAGLHGHGLPGQRRSVQGGAPGEDPPIGGHPLPGPHHHPVPQYQLSRGHGDLHPGPEHRGLIRDQLQQRAQPAPGARHRVLLQGLGDGVEEGQHRRFLDLPQGDRSDGGDGHQGPDPDLAPGQPAQRGGHERPSGRQQRARLQAQRHPQRNPGQRQDPAGQQQHPGRGGEPDLAHLPEALGLLPGLTGFVLLVAASAGIAHRVIS